MLACGEGDDPARESDDSSSRTGDAAANSDASSAPAPSSADGAVLADASTLDAGASESDSAVRTDASEPTLTLEQALQTAGENPSSERALLVIEAGCKQIVSCGDMQPVQSCIDDTMGEWVVGALFFTEPCLDAELDFYACIAQTPCTADAMTQCAEQRATQLRVCAES
jgi:hypothetical protein